MKVRLVDRPEVPVACLRHVGPYGPGVGRFWAETVSPWLTANGLQGAPRYGISLDDPSIADPAQCRYDACVEVAPSVALTGPAVRSTIPAGRYAVLDFKGTAAQIGPTWTALLRDWIPGSGLQVDSWPCFEHYPVGSTFDPATGIFTCEICIPVAPL
jgi:AraC family transcriptional regulator